MIKDVWHKLTVWLVAALMLSVTGCSVFISTPKVARFHIQQLDNRLVEVMINLDAASDSNLGIHLSNRYSLQLDFEWLWHLDERSEIYIHADTDSEESMLTPWMVCKYRF